MSDTSESAVVIPINPLAHRGALIFICTLYIVLGLVWITYLARIWTRLRIIRSQGLDDLWMGIAVVERGTEQASASHQKTHSSTSSSLPLSSPS